MTLDKGTNLSSKGQKVKITPN